jgi:drug/metabolite transporter (DMT)-like permease
VSIPKARPERALSVPVIIAICVTVVAWASAFVVIRGVAPHFDGGPLALLRLGVGAAVLTVSLAISRRWVWPNAREWLLLIVVGLAWFGAYNVMLNIAEHSLDAGTTAMIVGSGPILIALGAGVFLGEGVPRWLAIGTGVAFFGVVLIGLATGLSGGGDGVGILWAVGAAITYAVGVLCQKPTLKRLPGIQVTWTACVIGFLACLPFLGQLLGELRIAPVSSILGAVYLGAVPTALAFSTWAYALSRVPAGQLGVTTYLSPPLSILLALLFLGEVPPLLAVIGGAVCLVGVGLSRRRPKKAAAEALFTPEPKI